MKIKIAHAMSVRLSAKTPPGRLRTISNRAICESHTAHKMGPATVATTVTKTSSNLMTFK